MSGTRYREIEQMAGVNAGHFVFCLNIIPRRKQPVS
jgi:hypothetical protein